MHTDCILKILFSQSTFLLEGKADEHADVHTYSSIGLKINKIQFNPITLFRNIMSIKRIDYNDQETIKNTSYLSRVDTVVMW